MSESLDGVRLKIRRAWNQIDTLKNQIVGFIDKEPYRPRFNFDANLRRITVYVKVEENPDPFFGIQIGEILYNLRSALDQLVYRIVVIKSGKSAVTKKTQFPIFQSEAGFNDRGVPQNLSGADSASINIIRSEQPFPEKHGGSGEAATNPLWHLSELCNADKHRMIHVTGAMLGSFNVSFSPAIRMLRNVSTFKCGPGPIQENAVLATIDSPDFHSWPFADHYMKCELYVDVAFDERTPLVGGWMVWPTLIDIANRTERIAARIAEDVFKTEL